MINCCIGLIGTILNDGDRVDQFLFLKVVDIIIYECSGNKFLNNVGLTLKRTLQMPLNSAHFIRIFRKG